jgi:hypothetical protein
MGWFGTVAGGRGVAGPGSSGEAVVPDHVTLAIKSRVREIRVVILTAFTTDTDDWGVGPGPEH